MNKLCVAYLGAMILVLHLTSQVASDQNTTGPSVNGTMAPNATMAPTNATNLNTTDKNGCVGSYAGVTVLLPVVASLLHAWS